MIKFRVWHKEFNKFLIFGSEWFLDFDGNLYFNDINDRLNCGLSLVDKNLYTIQRWTGLKDENGIDIYEGDIVKYNPDKPIIRAGTVEFSDYYNGWSIRDNDCYPNSEFGNYSLASPFLSFNSVRIIGNIFENPDLLHSPISA